MWVYWLFDKLGIKRAVWLRVGEHGFALVHQGKPVRKDGRLVGYHADGLITLGSYEGLLVPDRTFVGRHVVDEWWYAYPRPKDDVEFMTYKALKE